MKNPNKLAEKITVDLEKKQIFIDGELFPYHVMPGVQVRDILDSNSLPTVELHVFANTIEVIPEVKK